MNVGELIEYLYQLDPTTLVYNANWILDDTMFTVYDYETFIEMPTDDTYPPRPACGKILYIG